MKLTVRGFGYGVMHLIEVPARSVVDSFWPSEDHPFKGVATPVVAICGVRVRSVQPLVVVMPDASPTCRSCVRRSS